MGRRARVMVGASLIALVGAGALFASLMWILWKDSLKSEEDYVGDLASVLGERAEQIILDTRDMLKAFDRLESPRCSEEHLKALQDAAIARPHIRAIGYWRAERRICGIGMLQATTLKPRRADRIYPSGVIAWWPSQQTKVGDVQLFLMRYGEHDVAIDPRTLLELGPTQHRKAGLWVEGLRMAASPWNADLPTPNSLPVGLTVDTANKRMVSRFSRNSVFPIDVVAIEPISSFWHRYARSLAIGAAIGLALVAGWLYIILLISRHQLSLATQLRQAIADGQIKVQYQPIVELNTGVCVGAEALARWERNNGERINPEVFIPVAEEAGLVPRITLGVLATIVHELLEQLRNRPGLSINLNLSPDDLKSEDFRDALSSTLASAALPNRSIKLEITERALINSDTARNIIREFRQCGHQVAVDDFGTGYSSLSYLESFELDVLKIDKTFVDAIGTESATSQVIVHVIEMAKSLGLETVAEGVETPEQLAWLQARGVRYVQGYLISRPMPAPEFVQYITVGQRPVVPSLALEHT